MYIERPVSSLNFVRWEFIRLGAGKEKGWNAKANTHPGLLRRFLTNDGMLALPRVSQEVWQWTLGSCRTGEDSAGNRRWDIKRGVLNNSHYGGDDTEAVKSKCLTLITQIILLSPQGPGRQDQDLCFQHSE